MAVALGQAACRAGKRVKFFTAAGLVNQLEESQKQYRLERLLSALEKVDLLIVDELGYLSFSRSGAAAGVDAGANVGRAGIGFVRFLLDRRRGLPDVVSGGWVMCPDALVGGS